MPLSEVWVVYVNASEKYFVETKGEAGRHCLKLAREAANTARHSRGQPPIPEKEGPLFKKQPPESAGIHMVYGDFGYSECDVEVYEFIEQRPSLLNGYHAGIYQQAVPLTRVHASALPRGEPIDPPMQSGVKPVSKAVGAAGTPLFLEELLARTAAATTPRGAPRPPPETPVRLPRPQTALATPTVFGKADAADLPLEPAAGTDGRGPQPFCDTPRSSQ